MRRVDVDTGGDVDPYAYAFDDVPNGIYEVNLRFAELTALSFGERLFDVIIESTQVLPAHDIRYEADPGAAADHTFFVEVTDARLDIRLVPHAGFADPIINSSTPSASPTEPTAER